MKNRWLKLMCIGLALVILLPGILACPGNDSDDFITSGTPDPDRITLVNPEQKARTTLDHTGDIKEIYATPDKGAVIMTHGMKLVVPPDAVNEEKQVQVTVLENNPFPEERDTGEPSAPAACPLSLVYDLGPEGIEFDKPVMVTLPYAESLLQSGDDENNVQIAYYNGVDWVLVGGRVDTENNTVTAAFTAFPGFEVITVIIVGGLATVIGYTGKIAGKAVYSLWVADPVAHHNANEYITPGNSTVKKYADYFTIEYGKEKVTLNDLVKNPGKFTAANAVNNPKKIPSLSYTTGHVKLTDGTNDYPLVYKVSDETDDWLPPERYLNEGRVGDCKNVANAMASMLRSQNIPAKCVDGFLGERDPNNRHIWVEFQVDGRAYYIGADGEVQPLEAAYKNFDLQRPLEGEDYMWDEASQENYRDGWWVKGLKINANTSNAVPGGSVNFHIFGALGMTLDIDLTITDSKNNKAVYQGTTDPETGYCTIEVPLETDSAGSYTAYAYCERLKSGMEHVFYVNFITMEAYLADEEYYPGDTVSLLVTLNPAVETDIEIEGEKDTWTSDDLGEAFPEFTVPDDAKPGEYDLTITAPDLGLECKATYKVGKSVTGADYNVAQVFLDIGVDCAERESGTISSFVTTLGNEWLKGEVNGNRFEGTTEYQNGPATVKFTYSFTFNDDFTGIEDGTVYSYTKHEKGVREYEFHFIDVSLDPQMDFGWYASLDMDKEGGQVNGSSVKDHITYFMYDDPSSSYGVNNYWADERCTLRIILITADDEDMVKIFGKQPDSRTEIKLEGGLAANYSPPYFLDKMIKTCRTGGFGEEDPD